MKNLLKIGGLLMVLFSSMVFSKNIENPIKTKVEVELQMRNGHKSIVSEVEYNSADDYTKRLINYIDASISALNILDTDVEAVLSVSKNKDDNFSNSIVISKTEKLSSPKEVYKGSCTVCGVSSAYSCLKKIKSDESLGDEFDVHVKRKGDCVTLSW